MEDDKKKSDGGPAFPGGPQKLLRQTDTGPYETFTGYAAGMSLRDWFAGQALEEDIKYHMRIKDFREGALLPHETGKNRSREAARYHYADEILREKQYHHPEYGLPQYK